MSTTGRLCSDSANLTAKICMTILKEIKWITRVTPRKKLKKKRVINKLINSRIKFIYKSKLNKT